MMFQSNWLYLMPALYISMEHYSRHAPQEHFHYHLASSSPNTMEILAAFFKWKMCRWNRRTVNWQIVTWIDGTVTNLKINNQGMIVESRVICSWCSLSAFLLFDTREFQSEWLFTLIKLWRKSNKLWKPHADVNIFLYVSIKTISDFSSCERNEIVNIYQ